MHAKVGIGASGTARLDLVVIPSEGLHSPGEDNRESRDLYSLLVIQLKGPAKQKMQRRPSSPRR